MLNSGDLISIGLKRIKHAYWLHAGYTSWSGHVVLCDLNSGTYQYCWDDFAILVFLLPANNSRTDQNCQNNSGVISVPELLIQAILGPWDVPKLSENFLPASLMVLLVTYLVVMYRVVPAEINTSISGKVLNLLRHSASIRKIIHRQFWYVPEF